MLDGSPYTLLLQRCKTHPPPRVKNSCSRLWNNVQEVRGGGRTAFAFAEDVGVLVGVVCHARHSLTQPAAAIGARLEGHGLARGLGIACLEALALGSGRHVLH